MYRNIRVEVVDLLQKVRQIEQNAEDVIFILEEILTQPTQPSRTDYDPDAYLIREALGMETLNGGGQKAAEEYSNEDIIRDF